MTDDSIINLAQWNAALDQELQDLLTVASDIRRDISDSKTMTKRKYYTKKFNAVKAQVMQMLTVKSQIEAKLTALDATELVDFNQSPAEIVA